MKLTKTCLVLFALASLITAQVVLARQDGETPAEQIILAYIKARGLNIQPATEEYSKLMKGILLGEHPDLIGEDSAFIESETERNDVIDYAARYIAAGSIPIVEPVVEEAGLPLTAVTQQSQGEANRANAIAYAYEWSESGNAKRNPAYPDFGADDCTNFISQAMEAGGFREVGSGDGCTHEETSVEWYVEVNPSPPLWCLGDFRDWEWSTSWSVPWPFRDYFAYQNSFATVPGWTTDVFTAKYYLSPGDVIQLQIPDGEDWVTYHTMIVTMEDENELYVTYHSNASGLDEVDKPLSSIPAGSSQRYVLVKINFPAQVYLPLVMKRWPPIPDTPVLNPINNPNGSSGYTVSWQAAYLASTYTLQEATNADFSGAVTRYSGTGTSWTATGKAPGTYYYRVKATNSWGDSGWSNTQQTTVWPTTRTFYSVADAMVRSGYPTSTYGHGFLIKPLVARFCHSEPRRGEESRLNARDSSRFALRMTPVGGLGRPTDFYEKALGSSACIINMSIAKPSKHPWHVTPLAWNTSARLTLKRSAWLSCGARSARCIGMRPLLFKAIGTRSTRP